MTQLSEQSLEQFARLLDLAGDRTNVEAIMHSSTVLSGGFEGDFARMD